MFPLFKFRIKGRSMEPALKNDDIILVNRLSYFFKKPKVGDIIVLRRKDYIIKRIAKISPSADGNKCFVLGDNKKESTDSRKFGWINKKKIIGKVIYNLSS